MKLNFIVLLIFTFICLFVTACSSTKNASEKVFKNNVEASYYADKFNGKKTASGEKFNNNNLTAAHKTLAFGTKLKVTNLANKKSVVVTVNDRGPHTKNRELDLSKRAVMEITDNKNHGTLRITIEILR